MAKPKPMIRALWKAKGITPAQFARPLKISVAHAYALANGNREVTAKMAKRIEKSWGLPRINVRPDLFA
jgi:plasmid maintenance system antidote protein VapI